MEKSALQNVFGSTASLAELSGDTLPSQRPKSAYSGFGLNERPQPHQMHTKTRRLSTNQPPVDFVPKRRWRWWQSLVIFIAFGIAQTWFMQLHVPLLEFKDITRAQKQALFGLGTVLSVIAGFVVPSTDRISADVAERRPSMPGSPALGRPDSRSSRPGSAGSVTATSPTSAYSFASSSRAHWTHALARGYGALLGIIYLTQKLSHDAVPAWVLIAPGVWFVGDATLNGFMTAVTVAIGGTLITLYLIPEVLASSQYIGQEPYSFLYVFASIAVAFFGTSLMAGNVGRGFRQ